MEKSKDYIFKIARTGDNKALLSTYFEEQISQQYKYDPIYVSSFLNRIDNILNDFKVALKLPTDNERFKELFKQVLKLVDDNNVQIVYRFRFKESENSITNKNEYIILCFLSEYPQIFQEINIANR